MIYTEANVIEEIEFPLSQYFREDLAFTRREGGADSPEFAVCESLIYPVLKEVWKHYYRKFILWSYQSVNYDSYLSGFSEYIILAKRSLLGKVIFEKPYFLLVEAKQDDFENAWVQCLAEMISAQQLNEKLEQDVFGIVSNGEVWQFGKLRLNRFTKNRQSYLIDDLTRLLAALNYVFHQCELMLDAEAGDRNSI